MIHSSLLTNVMAGVTNFGDTSLKLQIRKKIIHKACYPFPLGRLSTTLFYTVKNEKGYPMYPFWYYSVD